MPLKTVCTCCGQENCDGILYVCTNCGTRECKTSIEKDFKNYGATGLKKSNTHLYVRGMGQMWPCGPVVLMTPENENTPEIWCDDPRYRWDR